MVWEIIDTGCNSAQFNMDFDADLLKNLRSDPFLHFYSWSRRSITFGYFLSPDRLLDLSALAELEIDIARRPTGGGVVFHWCDLAFSVLIPASSPWYAFDLATSYSWFNGIVRSAISAFIDERAEIDLITGEDHLDKPEKRFFCMAKATKYDLVFQGKKVVGAAQRKTKKGILHQVTISLMAPEPETLKKVLPNEEIQQAIMANSHYLLSLFPNMNIEEGKEELSILLRKHFVAV